MKRTSAPVINRINGFTGNILLKKSALVFIVKAGGLAAGFIFTFIISRLYGAESLGIFSICLNLVQGAVLFTVAGFDSLLLKTAAQLNNQNKPNNLYGFYNRIFLLTLTCGLAVTFGFFYGSDFLAVAVFSKPELKPYLVFSSVMIVPLTFLLLHASGLRGLNKTGWFSFFRETSRFLIALPLVILLFIFFSEYQNAPLVSYSIAVIIAAIWCTMLWLKELKKNKRVVQTENTPGFFQLLTLSMPFFFVTFLAQLSVVLSPLILGIKGTTADVGVFNVALKIAGLLALPLMVVNMATANIFAEMKGTQDAGLKKNASWSAKVIFWTSLPLLLICLVFPGKMMLWFGSSFETGSTALILIAAGQFINAITGSVGVIMQMTGHEKSWAIILMCTTLLNILLLVLLIPRFGLNGAALSITVSIIANNIAGAIYLQKKMNIRTWYFPFLTS